MVSILGNKNCVFQKKEIAVGQQLACSFHLNFKDEIKCLIIKKRRPQGKKSANGQISNIGVGKGGGGLARFGVRVN